MAKNILIFGATGLIGRYITDAIVKEKDSFNRVVIFTTPATVAKKAEYIQHLKSAGVEIITGGITNEKDIQLAYQNIDTVISAVGRNIIASQITLLRLAEQSTSVQRFFPSEYGTDIEFGPKSAQEKPHQFKLKVRAYIKKEIRRLEYTYLVTGPYAELFIGKGHGDPQAGSYDVKGKKAVLLGTGNEEIALTTMFDVGRLQVAALKNPEAAQNRALIVNSFTTTMNKILAEYERQTKSKWEVEYVPLDRLIKLEDEAWKSGSPQATGSTLRRIWTEGGTIYDYPRDNGKIAFEETETLEATVTRAIKTQTGQD